MFDVRSYGCPECSSPNGVLASLIEPNEAAGAETWGACWACDAPFQMSPERRRDGGAQHLAASPNSPIGWNLSFSMWHRRRP